MARDPDTWLERAWPKEITAHIRRLNQDERREYDYTFSRLAHRGQLPPDGAWRTWLIMAGRGFGKTRAGAEWVRSVAESDPAARIALIGATLGEARSVMVEGESGLLRCCPPHNRPAFEPSLRRMSFANGALAFLYGANEPDSLRGPQHSHACRAGPEGVLRQRSPRTRRYPAASGDRGRSRFAARVARGRRMLAGRTRPDRRVGRPRRQARLVPGGRVDLRYPARRVSPARPGNWPGHSLPGDLAPSRRAGGANGRRDSGRRGARGDRRTGGHSDRERHSPARLTRSL